MNRKPKKLFSFVLAACLIMTTTALATVIGEQISGYDTFLGAEMELSRGVYWTGSDYRTENYIEYKPSERVKPVVVSGSKLCNYGNFSSMASLLEKEGKRVIAGMNGDYYVVATSEPLGIVVQNGELLSSDAEHYAVGFNADGTSVFGKPDLKTTVTINGKEFTADAINKTRKSGQMVVYTDDYSNYTKNSGGGYDFICSGNGSLTMNCNKNLTVEQVITKGGAVALPQGKIVVSVSSNLSDETVQFLDAVKAGDSISVGIMSMPEWSNVQYAVGSLYKLVTNGKVESGFTAGAAPRSAIGKKADGSLVMYTIDGRQTGHSVGVSMTQLANRMVEMGCVEATIMDGGGSTSLNAIYLGDSSVSQINKPSGGYQRSVSNYIMLVTDAKPTGKADRLAMYPLMTHILSGSSTNFTVKAADANGYATSYGGEHNYSLSADIGQISNSGRFIANGAGTSTLSVSSKGMQPASVQINAVVTPDELYTFNENDKKAVSKLNVKTQSSTPLSASAVSNHMWLISQDNAYDWSITGNIGTIDDNGNFTAGTENASGTIIVKAGDKVKEIQVTVTNPGLYDDVQKSDWFYDEVEYVSEKGIMDGTEYRKFSPYSYASRGMICTMLYRMEGSPSVTPNGSFADVPENSWYTNAVYWAQTEGIVQGYDGNFLPNNAITRQELATIIYRYKDNPTPQGSIDKFEDAKYVSSWATDAMAWCVGKNIISGVSDNKIAPTKIASRAEAAAIFGRMS